MYYLHVIETGSDVGNVKSMFIEELQAYQLGALTSVEEKDNIIIINEIVRDQKNIHKRIMNIKYVFINGSEDIEYSEVFHCDKKK